jgi:ABC-type enterobactin transport system permease subunit
MPLSDAINPGDAVALVKEQIAAWVMAPEDFAARARVSRWRRRRSWVIAQTNLPLALGAFVIGGLLGFAVAMFAVSSGLIGWPMILAGVFIGASAGAFLKFIADKKSASGSPALAGSWGRFAVVTTSALIGAGVISGTVLTFFWT